MGSKSRYINSLSHGSMRCFFGIPVENREELIPVQEKLVSSKIRLVRPENVHITFIFLGEIGESVVEKMCAALEKLSFRKPVVKTVGVIGLPQDRKARVIALRLSSPELESYYYEFSKSIGFSESRRYLPHITLARCKTPVQIKQENVELPDEIVVGRISLFKSTLTPEGPIYEELCHSQFM